MPTAYSTHLTVNGRTVSVTGDDNKEDLLYVLRNQLALNGPKYGCGRAQCGACTVLVDGVVTRSCITTLGTVKDGARVTTLEGLGTVEQPHPMQAAFIEQQAGQCAYCANAMIVGATGWLQARRAAGKPSVPTEDEVRNFLSGKVTDGTATTGYVYLCRCGSHMRIIQAIIQAAEEM
jgi:aerobic-type carbon monoxide dehydrogenase small subunit (CoxS/CutS family)